jgi:hypothetical protein
MQDLEDSNLFLYLWLEKTDAGLSVYGHLVLDITINWASGLQIDLLGKARENGVGSVRGGREHWEEDWAQRRCWGPWLFRKTSSPPTWLCPALRCGGNCGFPGPSARVPHTEVSTPVLWLNFTFVLLFLSLLNAPLPQTCFLKSTKTFLPCLPCHCN